MSQGIPNRTSPVVSVSPPTDLAELLERLKSMITAFGDYADRTGHPLAEALFSSLFVVHRGATYSGRAKQRGFRTNMSWTGTAWHAGPEDTLDIGHIGCDVFSVGGLTADEDDADEDDADEVA